MLKLGRNLDSSQGIYVYTFQNKYEQNKYQGHSSKHQKNIVKSLVSQNEKCLFVKRLIRAKLNRILLENKLCRPKTEVALHDFAKIAHHYKGRSHIRARPQT